MIITKEEIISELETSFNNKIINTNNPEEIVNELPIINDSQLEKVYNVKINMHRVCVEGVLTYIMAELRDRNLFNPSFTYGLPFKSKLEIPRFDIVLSSNNLKVQLIFYNMDKISEKNQELFNELYYYNSSNFKVVTFIDKSFITYKLFGNRLLEENINYQNYNLQNNKTKIKYRG